MYSMRYIDTGARSSEHALGTWLAAVLDTSVVALRWQTGFFGDDALGSFAPTMARLHKLGLIVRILIGSNDGITRRSDIESLIAVAGPPRVNQRLGIVSFDKGYFHPKTVHIKRSDGSAAAYVGSANLTSSGIASLHVEAGLLVDTRNHDDAAVLSEIAAAIDWWFTNAREGLSIVETSSDLDALVRDGILDVPLPPPPPRPRPQTTFAPTRRGAILKSLLKLPRLSLAAAAPKPPPRSQLSATATALQPVTPRVTTPARWWKKLTPSDAQRKPSGNQRGSITLTQAGHSIDAQTYFRDEFFGNSKWNPEVTSTGEQREAAVAPFRVNFLGTDLGVGKIMLTHAANRESSQANYTSLLHLGSFLAPHFAKSNATDKWLELSRLADGSYSLSIRDTAS